MQRRRDYYTALPDGHGLGRTGTGKWVTCKGCSQSFSYTVFCGRHMDACPRLLPLRRLLEGRATEGLAGAPTAAAAAGAAHRGSTSGPGSYGAPALGGGGAGAAPRTGGGGPTLGTAALANFGGASACARGATGPGNAGVPNDAYSGMVDAIMRASAAGRGSDARDVKPVGGAPRGPGMGQRGPPQAAGGAGVVKQEGGSGPRAGAPQLEAEDCDDDEELDDELEDGSGHGSGAGSEEDSWEERQRRRAPGWYLSPDEMEDVGPEDAAWYKAQEWEEEEEEVVEEEEDEESDLGSEAGKAAVAELRAHLDQPLYPGARAGLTLRASCQVLPAPLRAARVLGI